MEAKKYLLQIKGIERIIKHKKDRIKDLRETAEGISAFSLGDRVQTSSYKDLSDTVSEYLEKEEKLLKDINLLISKKEKIISVIEMLNEIDVEGIEYDIIYTLYVVLDKKDFYYIAEKYSMSYSWATSIHGRALAHIQNILDQNEKEEL